MKKNWRTGIVSTVVITLFAITMVGCNSNTKEAVTAKPAASPATEEAAAPSPAKQAEVTVAVWDVGKNLTDPATDELLKTIQDKTNIQFKAQNVTWNDYKEKFNLWAASGELPDMFVTDFRMSATFDTWKKQGLIRSLPADLSKYPNLQKVMELPDIAPLKVDDKFYFIPRLSKLSPDEYALERGFVVRKDWMDKLGIKQPTTFDEYLAMFKAFAEQDPDGNGKADTIGMTHNFNGVLTTTLALGSSIPNLGGWMQEDGKWIPSLASKGMVDYLTMAKRLYNEGALDKDFAVLKANDGLDKFAQGNVGALAIQIADGFLKNIKDKWDKANPGKSFEDSIMVLPVWKAPDGNQYRFYGSTAYSDIYFSSKVDDEKLDALLKLIDYNLSDEGKNLYSYGFEGKDYKVEGDKIVPLQERTNYPSYGFFWYLNGIGHSMNVSREARYSINPQKLVDMAFDEYDWMLKNTKPIPMNFNVEFINTPAKSKFFSGVVLVDDLIKGILSNEDPKTYWDKQIKTYESQGLNEAIKEVNDTVAKEGIK